MILGTNSAKVSISDLCVDGNAVQRVNVFKLLGVLLDNNLKWNYHVDAVCAKASSRLHFLKILKRSSLSAYDLFYLHTSFIRPFLEYACPAWHNSLILMNKVARLSLFRSVLCALSCTGQL